MANQKLKDAVAKLLADDVSKTKQVVDLTAAGEAKDVRIAALLTAQDASKGTIDDLNSQLSTVTASTAILQTQIVTLTKAAADNDADDNALADTLSASV